ncbi:MAG: hypothetical protein HRT57_07780, partial [Crocinitomicaceae bacterium]|nr:hypothetical protein [Crocinitomicaceae bacterium]
DDETCVDFCDGFINLTGSGGTYLDVVTSKTFTYGGGDGTTIVGKEISEFDIDVTGMSVMVLDVTSLTQVCVDLTMAKSEKTDIYLIAPDGSEVGLFWGRGGMNEVFNDVCFDVGASNISNSGAPFLGSWSAEEFDFDDASNPIIGAPTNGAWTLWVDHGDMNDAVLDGWTMTFNDLVPAVPVPAFVWDGPAPIAGSTNDDISGLCDDTYTVTATDDLGCFTTFEREILTVPDVYSDIRIVPNKCFYAGTNSYDFYSDGLSSGNGYSFLWEFVGGSGGTVTDENPTGISYAACGDYEVVLMVTDDNTGCSVTDTARFTVSCDITALLTPTPPLCFEQCNGSIAMTAAEVNYTSSFTYAWEGQNTGYSSSTRNPTDLCDDTYDVTVTDATFCTAVFQTVVTDPTELIASVTMTDETCNLSNDGTATVTFSGGTALYSANWGAGPTGGLSAGTSVIGPLPGAAGGLNYTVTLSDAKGCIRVLTGSVDEPTAVTATITDHTDPICFEDSNGDMEVTYGGGISPYTVAWPSTSNTNQAAGTNTEGSLIAGNYIVTITDANGCPQTATETLFDPTELTVTTTGVDPLCNGDNNGSTLAVPAGGTGAYRYSWGGAFSTSNSSTNLVAGTYTVSVMDDNDCMVTSEQILIQPALLVATPVVTDITCNEGSDGAINMTIVGGTVAGAYQYAWSTLATSEDLTGLAYDAAGRTITVTDDNGCNVKVTSTPIEPAPITYATSEVQSTCSLSDGSALITGGDPGISGGTSPYTYVWSDLGTQTTTTASNVPAGNYTVTVRDVAGCTVPMGQAVTDAGSPTVDITFSTPILDCIGDNDGTATAAFSGGVAPYVITWTSTVPANIATAGNTTINNLTAGLIGITVEDYNNCIRTAEKTILDPPVLTASATGSTNPSCATGSDGTVTAAATGGTVAGDYQYLWSDAGSQTNATAIGLPQGTYTVTITDDNGCKSTDSRVITDPPALTLSITGTDPLCFEGTDGTLTATPGGGTVAVDYQYTWTSNSTTGPAATATPAGLASGTYTLEIEDYNGCVLSEQHILNDPPELIGSTTPTDVYCAQTNGQIATTISGGTVAGAYQYLWSDAGSQTSAIATSIGAGSYTVVVKDDNGCAISITDVIADLPGVKASASVVTHPFGPPPTFTEGEVTSSGDINGPWSYVWDDPGTQATQNATGLTGALGPGGTTYCVTITDDEDCDDFACTPLIGPPVMEFDLDTVHVSCFGGNDGEVLITYITGGNPAPPAWTYAWNSGSVSGTGSTGLIAGDYTVTVTDALGVQVSYSLRVNEPTEVLASITDQNDPLCNGDLNGDMEVTFSGGTGPYDIDWPSTSNPAEPAGINLETGLGSGNYIVTVRDSKGCITTTYETLVEPFELTAVIAPPTDPLCFGSNDGEATVTIGGGTMDYVLDWSQNGSGNDQASYSFANHTALELVSGLIEITVTDANMCEKIASETLADPTVLGVTITYFKDPSCTGVCDGEAEVTLSGGTAPYDISWDNNGADDVMGSFAFVNRAFALCGNTLYTAQVTDANGCIATVSRTLTEPAQVVVVVTGNDPVCNGDSNGDVRAAAGGGTSNFTYVWDDLTTTTTITGLPIG